jgi:ATP-binding cassette subfamily B protein
MSPAAGPPPTGAPGGDLAATSFIAYLVDTYGGKTLRDYLAACDTDRSDQAATTAYRQPLAKLEEAWLGTLRQRPNSGAVLRSFIAQILPLLKPYRWQALEALGYMLLGALLSQAPSLGTSFIQKQVVPSGNAPMLVAVILGLVLVLALNGLVTARRGYVVNWINQTMLTGLQEKVFTHLQRLPHSFFGRVKLGDLMTRQTSDLQVIQQAIGQVGGDGLYQAILFLATAVHLIIRLRGLGAALVLVIIPVFYSIWASLRTRVEQASRDLQRSVGEASATFQENVSAYPVVKAYGLEGSTRELYHNRLQVQILAAKRMGVIAGVAGFIMNLAMNLGLVLTVGIGAFLVMRGKPFDLAGTVMLVPMLFQPVMMIATMGQTVQMATGSLDRVQELLDEPVTISDRPGAVPLPPAAREIRLENVSFSYDGKRPILRDFDVAIPAGTNVAIVGGSGSGKSTVVNLLLRFWDPDEGRVLIDGKDLRDVTLASLRGQIGLVFQDTYVFNTTVRENIRIGRSEAKDAEIVEAAKAAQIHDIIERLPQKYETILPGGTGGLSGGERQRLAIARAVLRNPRILVLDEPTSALDAHTEAEILETLAELKQGRTTISITHRLSLAAASDHILVVDQGQLVEQGSHAELVRAGGHYQGLYEEQTGYVTAEAASRPEVDLARLRTVPLLSGLSPEALGALVGRLSVERYAAGEEVVRQGDPGDRLYIINRGGAEVLVGNGQGERRVNTLRDGDYFGEIALLAGVPRTATVRATAPTQLYSIGQADFQALLQREPGIRQTIQETVAGRRAALAAAVSAAGAPPVLTEGRGDGEIGR